MSTPIEKPLERFVSKADTLQVLSGLLTKSLVEDLHVFLEADWELNRPEIVDAIRDRFQGKTIIVRSSALSEDTVSRWPRQELLLFNTIKLYNIS